MAQSSQRKPTRPGAKPPAKTGSRPGAKQSGPKRSGAGAGTPVPGATLLWVLLASAVLWFAGQLWALRGTLRAAISGVELGPEAITPLITFGLPTVISAAVVVGAVTGLTAAVLLAGRVADPRWVRLGVAAGAGLLAAAVTGAALYVSGYGVPAALGVAAAGFVGGLAATVPARVLAAAVAGALGVAVTQFVSALFTSPLRGLLDGGGTGPEIAAAGVNLARITGVVAGVVAGLVGYFVLRRYRPVSLGGHVVAGAGAGLFLLVAELITRFTLPAVIAAAGGMLADEIWLLQKLGEARLNGALVVLFAGAISCLIALGRSMPRKPPRQFTPRRPPATTPATEED